MAKKVKKVTKPTKPPKTLSQDQKISEQVKLSESYISLLLGAVVVVVLAVAFFALVKGGSVVNKMNEDTNYSTPSATTSGASEQTYTLKEGESLWDVAVKFYGDGYKWTVISKANGYGENADYIEPGTKLKIPPVK